MSDAVFYLSEIKAACDCMHVPRKFTLSVMVIYVSFSFQASKCNSFSFHMKLVHIKIIVEENHIPCSHRARVFSRSCLTI